MVRRYSNTHTLQVWPGGAGYTYRGDPDGPVNQRSLRLRHETRWRKGLAQEWRNIRIETRAEMYADRDILCCDSSLVTDLMALSNEVRTEIGTEFSIDEIRNMYQDPSDWDAARCREYASDQGIDLPTSTQQTACEHCGLDIEGDLFADDWRDRGNNTRCNDGKHAHAPGDNDTEESEWVEEAREACREHTQENPAEVYEWYRVDSWLCEQLHGIGEVTIENDYGCWWGRQATGQMLIMDGTLQQVAAQYERGTDG